MTTKMKLAAVATIAVAFLWSLPAHASTVTVGVGATPIPVLGCGPNSSGSVNCIFASAAFLVNTVTGIGNPPNTNPTVLGSTSLNNVFLAAGGGTLDVWVTSQGNVALGPSFTTLSTSTGLPEGWTVEVKTWIGPDDTIFGRGTLIGDHTFTGTGMNMQIGGASPANPYSITAEYIITSTSAGAANTTLQVTAPEPSSLLLLGTGLLGLGFSLRRKHI